MRSPEIVTSDRMLQCSRAAFQISATLLQSKSPATSRARHAIAGFGGVRQFMTRVRFSVGRSSYAAAATFSRLPAVQTTTSGDPILGRRDLPTPRFDEFFAGMQDASASSDTDDLSNLTFGGSLSHGQSVEASPLSQRRFAGLAPLTPSAPAAAGGTPPAKSPAPCCVPTGHFLRRSWPS